MTLLAAMIRSAQFLGPYAVTGPKTHSYAYVRGQAELICDLAGLPMDDFRDAIMLAITGNESDLAALLGQPARLLPWALPTGATQ